jgi:hypothetical protein
MEASLTTLLAVIIGAAMTFLANYVRNTLKCSFRKSFNK